MDLGYGRMAEWPALFLPLWQALAQVWGGQFVMI